MEDSQYVGFGARFRASMVDTILCILIILSIYYLIYGDLTHMIEGKMNVETIALQYIFPFVATLIFWIYKSATPGKMLLKAVIVDANTYEKPTKKQLLIRNIGYYLSLLPLGLGYFWIIWDKKKQGWHDKLANTIVIQPKTEQKSIGFGGYLLRGLGLFFVLILLGAMYLGTIIELNMIPDGNIYKVDRLSKSVKEEIIDKKIVNTLDNLLYLQPDSSFSFTEEGTIITKQGVSIFSTSEEDKLVKEFFAFKDIGNLEVSGTNDLDIAALTMLEDTLNFKVLLINIYDEEGVLIADPIITIEGESNFEKEILELWRDASASL